jgi:hypothetical protein
MISVACVHFVMISFGQAADRNPQIQKAIDRGVAFVRSKQGQDGSWKYETFAGTGSHVGATALVGLTLLECGVPASDPAVQQAVQFVRKNAPSLIYTYGLSTSIWFLDRLGDEADVYLIQFMAVRLLAGQNEAGGWTYNCPVVAPMRIKPEVRNLKLETNPKPKEANKVQEDAKEKEKKRHELTPEIQDLLKRLAQPQAAPQQPQVGANGDPYAPYAAAAQSKGDNSNTQFAALGLWVARRYGVPVESALIRIEKRYRATQVIDGGWNYMPNYSMGADHDHSPAMTCAGLIGLAVGHGAAVEAPKEKKIRVIDPDKDNNMQAGFRHLGDILLEYSQLRVIGGTNDSSFYFLWSMERVAEIYGLKTIGRRDWYAWGSNVLLNSQSEDGGWYGRYHPSGIDSCFALLFLVRANVAKDLSVTLRGKMRDPGTRTLKAGGVGAEALKKSGEGRGASAEIKRKGDVRGSAESTEKKTTEASETSVATDASAARRMSDELATANDGQQSDLLTRYKEGKGQAYTQALAGAIPRLKGENKIKAREALAERLTRMTADTLRTELKDDDPEIRRAASLACAMKDDKIHVPDLIPLLDDPEPLVGRAAHAALKSLTSQDFGPPKDASSKDRAKAMEAWKDWWVKQENK